MVTAKTPDKDVPTPLGINSNIKRREQAVPIEMETEESLKCSYQAGQQFVNCKYIFKTPQQTTVYVDITIHKEREKQKPNRLHNWKQKMEETRPEANCGPELVIITIRMGLGGGALKHSQCQNTI